MRDQRQERPGSDEGDAPADRHALRLEGDLRRPEGEHPRQGPAREGQGAVHGAGGEHQPVHRDPLVTPLPQTVEIEAGRIPGGDAPHHHTGTVIDPRRQRVGKVVQGARPAGLEAVEVGGRPLGAGRGPAIDLATGAVPLVEEERAQARLGQPLRRPQSRRPGPDDGDQAHSPTPPVTTAMPGSTRVVQARTRRPSARVTQQSWQAPIRQ